MRKYLAAALILPALIGTLKLPVHAADDQTIFDDALKLTVDATALGTGLVVGIPLSICQAVPKSVDDITQKIQADMSDDRSATSYVAAAVPALPAGTVYGVASGIVTGAKKALANYHDHPFSNESLSLK